MGIIVIVGNLNNINSNKSVIFWNAAEYTASIVSISISNCVVELYWKSWEVFDSSIENNLEDQTETKET